MLWYRKFENFKNLLLFVFELQENKKIAQREMFGLQVNIQC